MNWRREDLKKAKGDAERVLVVLEVARERPKGTALITHDSMQ